MKMRIILTYFLEIVALKNLREGSEIKEKNMTLTLIINRFLIENECMHIEIYLCIKRLRFFMFKIHIETICVQKVSF